MLPLRRQQSLNPRMIGRKPLRLVGANSGVRTSKYNFINDNIEDASGDPKRFWQQVTLLIPNIKLQMIDYVLGDDGITPLRGKDVVLLLRYLNTLIM